MKNVIIERTQVGYDTLVDAVSCAVENDVIKLNNDLSGAGVAMFALASNGIQTKSLTIDFNGKTYTCTGPAVGSRGTQSQAFHLEATSNFTPKTVVLKNGTITTTANSGVLMVIQNYDNLTIENMTVDGTNLPTQTAVRYVVSNNNGGLNLKNSTLNAAPDDVAFDVCGYRTYPSVSAVVSDSTVNGNIEVTTNNSSLVHQIGVQLNSGTTVNGKLVGDKSITADLLKTSVSIKKDPSVSLAVDTEKFGDFDFKRDGSLVPGEEKREEDKHYRGGGAAYSQYLQQIAYVRRQREMMQRAYIANKR